MTKANDLASLLDANGDVVSSALDNVPPSNDASALSTGTLAAARLPADIVVSDASPELSADLATNSNDINFGTNAKSNYGTSAQLMMYHDGSNGWIKGNNAGNNSIAIQSGGTGSVMISGSSGQNIISQQGDSAYLHHAGFAKLITTATGVDAINTAGSSTSRFGSTYNTGANDGTLVIGNGGSGKAMLRFDYEGTNTDRARIGVSSSAQQLEFYTAGDNKRATLDASGNLLVGKASADGGVAGFEARSTGETFATSSGATLYAKRTTGDGDIIVIQASSGTVGSIGTLGGSLFVSSPQGTDAGLKFGNSVVDPCGTTGGNRDNAIDLGWSANRFKNLYLSGGVYLGGTGSANLLDSYEEGTYTATITPSSGSITLTYDQLKYTKIGRLVTVMGLLYVSSVSSPSGYATFNLPFAVSTGDNFSNRSAGVPYANNWVSLNGNEASIVATESNSVAYFIDISGTPVNGQAMGQQFQTGTEFFVTLTYHTNA